MRSFEPLPGTLVRTPRAFGEPVVSQMFTVVQKGRSPSWMSARLVAARAELSTGPPRRWLVAESTGGISATTRPGGSTGGESAPAGRRNLALAGPAARRDAAQASRTVGAASLRTTARTSGHMGVHLSVGH